MTECRFQGIIGGVACVELNTIPKEVNTEWCSGAFNDATGSGVIDLTFAPRSAGIAVCRFAGLAQAEAESLIAWVIVGIQSQMVAKRSHVSDGQHSVGLQLALEGKIDVLNVGAWRVDQRGANTGDGLKLRPVDVRTSRQWEALPI